MHRLLSALIISLLLVSCSPLRQSIALVSDGGITVYMMEGDAVRVVRSGSVKARYLEDLAGTGIEEAVSELFGIAEEDIYSVSREDYSTRRHMLSHLAEATDSVSPEAALWEHGKDLEKSSFVDTIDALSSSFDSALLARFPVGEGDYAEYRLGNILGSPSSWTDALDFMDEWIDSVFGD